MSDNMERDKSERLNARKIEEEEMKRELTGNKIVYVMEL